jgi:type I restriction enzyme, S subunit
VVGPIEQKIDPNYYPIWMTRGLPRAGDVVMTTEGPLGEIAQLDENTARYALGQRIVCMRGKDKVLDNTFLKFLLMSQTLQNTLASYATGTTVAGISQKSLRSVPISIPPYKEQIAVGQLLGALDDKIDLNHRMNGTLEATARTVFRDWFVDFGPARGKMEGRAPYLAPEIWSLFPDLLDDEGKPQGWEVSTIGREVNVVGGSTPSTKVSSYWGGDYCWTTPKDLSSLKAPVLFATERSITEAGLSQISSGLLPIGTVLLSSRAPIGYLVISMVPTAVNQGFIAMVCRGRVSNIFAWLWAKENRETILQNANGSTFQEISKTNFRPIPLIVPPALVLAHFDNVARPLFDRIADNEKEIQTLAETRDLLLPKLMSGEIRISDAEKMIEAE